MRTLRMVFGVGLAAFLVAVAGPFSLGAAHARPAAGKAEVRLPSSSLTTVTIYGATWCGPCQILERGLKERDIPFDVVDIDRNPDAYARARQATGTNSIPLTNVTNSGNVTWIVGADIAAVERAYRGR